MLTHFALHRFNLLPSTLLALPRKEKAFVFASIDIEMEKEKKEQSKLRKGR